VSPTKSAAPGSLRRFLCGEAADSGGPSHGEVAHELRTIDTESGEANVNLRLENISEVFAKSLRPRLIDLLEIAAYVFAADCFQRRGTRWTDEGATEPWDREIGLFIPVRDVGFWQREEVTDALAATLNFLSDDRYSFQFLEKQQPDVEQTYLELRSDVPELTEADRIVMFSGGLDSLAGAVEAAASGQNLVLVSHRTVAHLNKKQCILFDKLSSAFPDVKMLHVPVWVNKMMKSRGMEPTQRTRSFLFAALGTVVAEFVKAGGVRFYENGIVSLNLPIADEIVRARASRTTNPQSLHHLQGLMRRVIERDEFVIDDPFLFRTKSEVVGVLKRHGVEHLIPYTCSCVHQRFKSALQQHCGGCSQCIDRRVAILALELDEQDLAEDYESDVFTGPRKEGYEYSYAVDYLRNASETLAMSEDQFASRFGLQLARAARTTDRWSETAKEFIAMHFRQAETVMHVTQKQLQLHAGEIFRGGIEPTSMLGIIGKQHHLRSRWAEFAERITEVLAEGIPTACATNAPQNERHLQELCDAMLKAADIRLRREFPFMCWSSVLTKPDWSMEDLDLLVELKYVRKREDIRPITRDIAEDITKYGDNGRRVLFVVYDPQHKITNEVEFSGPVAARGETMLIRFIR
jgi:DpnII restriction endonuclease